MEKDVLRRDFTINSLALSLNQGGFADLIDFVGGFEDLKSKKIKVLHEKSFIDDPTRIIRGLKYATRLGFELDEKTLALQKEYLNNINYDMCFKRVKQEIKKTFMIFSQNAFEQFITQGIYKLITSSNQILRHAELVSVSCNPSNLENGIDFLIKKYKPKYPWLVCLGVLILEDNISKPITPSPSPPKGEGSCPQSLFQYKFELTKYERDVIEGAESFLDKIFSNDFEIYKAFSVQKLESLMILAILGKAKEVIHFLDNLKKIKLQINGNDLLELGFTPSKSFSEGFDYVLGKKIENPDISKAEELRLIQEFFKR